MTDKERKAHIKKSSGNYMRGRAMALSFKPLTLQDVKDAYECGAEEMESIIDNSMWWKSAEGEDLPDIDREVIALTTDGNVVFAHRPTESWQHNNLDTGEVTTYYPKQYDAGGWNIPGIKWWLDIEVPDRDRW